MARGDDTPMPTDHKLGCLGTSWIVVNDNPSAWFLPCSLILLEHWGTTGSFFFSPMHTSLASSEMRIVELLLLGTILSFADCRCYVDNSTGTLLPQIYGPGGLPICAPGFYCPGLVPSDPSTYPVYCPPSPDCQLNRLLGSACTPQGSYEPIMCPGGYFCPGGAAQLACPVGHFCPLGSTTPIQCDSLSLCNGEQNSGVVYLGGALASALIVMVLCVVIALYRRFGKQSTVVGVEEDVDNPIATPVVSNAMSKAFPAADETGMDTTTSLRTTDKRRSSARRQAHRDVDERGDQNPLLETSSLPTAAQVDYPNRPSSIRAYSSIATSYFCSGFVRSRGDRSPLTIEFKNLSLSVTLPSGERKKILAGANGHISPGKVVAIMGPSGSGKTTLMNCLLGRSGPGTYLSGELTVNGDSDVSKYRAHMGFVPQDDVLHEELTVYRNVYYTSELRLPRSWSSGDRHRFRSSVLDAMGLVGVRDVVIGDEDSRGVSGGQRKRASIAVELAGAPLAVFLDEPTSGLDSATALTVCGAMQRVAEQAMIPVAMVIHQPRREIWETLDELLLLAPGGLTAYQGPRSGLEKYLKQAVGVVIPPNLNPADVVMDLLTERGPELVEKWVNTHEEHQSRAAGAANSTQQFRSDFFEAEGISLTHRCIQCYFVHIRSLEKQANQLQALFVEFLQSLLLGAILGEVMVQVEFIGFYKNYQLISPTPFSDGMPQFHMYSLMAIGMAASTAGVNMFANDQRNAVRECSSGVSRISFYIGTVSAATARIIISSLIFSSVVHALGQKGFSFPQYFSVILVSYWAIYAVAGCVGILCRKEVASLIACAAALAGACLNGFIDFPRTMCKFSFAFWASEVLQELLMSLTASVFEDTLAPWGWEGRQQALAHVLIITFGLIFYGAGLLAFIRHCKKK